jgi:hypothetical protein
MLISIDMLTKILAATLFLFSSCYPAALPAEQVPDSVFGDWYGESKCTVPNSPCKDEVVVYHITRIKDSSGKVHWAADKIVDGKPEAMGEQDFDYNAAKSELRGEFKVPRTGGTGVWLFKIDGDKMHGTLTSDNELYRKVEVSRKKPSN